MGKKTKEQFITEIKAKSPNTILIGEYTNTKVRTRFKCSICGNEWETIPGVILAGGGCPKCGRNRRMRPRSHEDFAAEIAAIGLKIQYVDKYVNYKTRIKVKCAECGFEWVTSPDNLRRGYGCPICNKGRTTSKSHEQFVKELNERGIKTELLGRYVDSTTKILVRCPDCGYERLTIPSTILRGRECPKCVSHKSNKRKTHEQFLSEIQKKGMQVEVLGKYVNNKTKIPFRCKVCGYEWESTPKSLFCS